MCVRGCALRIWREQHTGCFETGKDNVVRHGPVHRLEAVLDRVRWGFAQAQRGAECATGQRRLSDCEGPARHGQRRSQRSLGEERHVFSGWPCLSACCR